MSTLWLTGVSPSKKVAGVRALRTLRADPANLYDVRLQLSTVQTAAMYFDAFAAGKEEPTIVADENDPGKIAKLIETMDEGGLTYEVTADDGAPTISSPERLRRALGGDCASALPAAPRPSRRNPEGEAPHDPPGDEPDPADEAEYAWTVAGTLAVIMAAAGSPAASYAFAVRLLNVTGDPLYQSVVKLLMATFPAEEGAEPNG